MPPKGDTAPPRVDLEYVWPCSANQTKVSRQVHALLHAEVRVYRDGLDPSHVVPEGTAKVLWWQT